MNSLNGITDQPTIDTWVVKSKRSDCKIEKIPYDKDLIDATGEPLSLVFKVSDKLQYQVTCPKEFLMTASSYFSQMLNGGWKETRKSSIEVDLLGLDVEFSKKHFELLSDYINCGEINDISQWSLAELKALYSISNFLAMEETSNRVTGQIISKLGREFSWHECLCFGIKHQSSVIIGTAFPYIIGDYLTKIEIPPSMQYLSNKLSLIQKGISICGVDKVTKLCIENYFPKGIDENPNDLNKAHDCVGEFYYPLKYPFPKEVYQLFPHVSKLVLRRYDEFSRSINEVKVNIEKDENGDIFFVRRPEDCPVVRKVQHDGNGNYRTY